MHIVSRAIPVLFLTLVLSPGVCDSAGHAGDALRREVTVAVAQGKSLKGRDFSGADFTGLTLAQADLRGSNLVGSNLKGVDMREAILEAANLDN